MHPSGNDCEEEKMKIRDEYFVTYINYPLITNKNKKKHIEFFNEHDVIDFWGANINIEDLLKRKFDVGIKETENKNHEILKIVSTQIVAGTPLYKIDGLGNISDEVMRNQPRKIFRGKASKKGIEKIAESEIWNPLQHSKEGDRLYNLACHSLMHFLKIRDNEKRLKKCPHCPKFFIAKDTKREICYDSDECFRKEKTEQKRMLRLKKKKEKSQNNAGKNTPDVS
jgi:hypothetical protein